MPVPAGQEKRDPAGPAAPLGRPRPDQDGAGAPGPLQGHDAAFPTPEGRVFLPPFHLSESSTILHYRQVRKLTTKAEL